MGRDFGDSGGFRGVRRLGNRPFEHQILQLLVIEFGFGEQNGEPVQLFFACFACLATILISVSARFLGLLPRLRFKPLAKLINRTEEGRNV